MQGGRLGAVMKFDAILTATQANETCFHLNCHMGETEVRNVLRVSTV